MVGVIVFSANLLTNAKLEWVPSHYNKKFVLGKILDTNVGYIWSIFEGAIVESQVLKSSWKIAFPEV